jgi:hypothetical protein
MRIAGTLAGLAIAISFVAQADAIEGGSATVSRGLELSHELRPFPRPPIIVNAVPPAQPQKNVESSQAQPMAHATCAAQRSQGSAPACREWQKISPPRPAS